MPCLRGEASGLPGPMNREPTDPAERPGAGIPGFQTGEDVNKFVIRPAGRMPETAHFMKEFARELMPMEN